MQDKVFALISKPQVKLSELRQLRGRRSRRLMNRPDRTSVEEFKFLSLNFENFPQ